MKHIKTSQLIKSLESAGYESTRQKGSHLTLTHCMSGLTVTIVNTALQSPGVVRNISKLTGVSFGSPQKVKRQADSLPLKFWDVVNELGLNPFGLSESDKKIVLELC